MAQRIASASMILCMPQSAAAATSG
jgi:hypothetical protein